MSLAVHPINLFSFLAYFFTISLTGILLGGIFGFIAVSIGYIRFLTIKKNHNFDEFLQLILDGIIIGVRIGFIMGGIYSLNILM